MSVEVITWALSQRVPRSSAKFVLVAMANCAANDGVCYPSMAYLSDATEQDRKTVAENIRRLKEWGFIAPTGEHRGATNQVVVYRLNAGTSVKVELSQKRNCSENGTHPKTDINTPENGHEQAQKRTATPPKTGHGTVRNRQEPSGTEKTARKRATQPESVTADLLVAAGFDGDTAAEFIAVKAQRGAPLTARAWADHVREAGKAGWTPMQAAEKVMAKTWKGFEAKYVADEVRPGREAPPTETAYARQMREKYEQISPGLAARRPGSKPSNIIDMEAPNGTSALLG